MTFCIEKFASSLCLGFGTSQSVHNPKLNYFNHFENPIDVCRIIQKLYKMYLKEFHSIIDAILDEDKYDSFELLMKAFLSRCEIISTNPTYFHFMLACTVITAPIFTLFLKVKCFTFANVASKSLIAMYDRYYKNVFSLSNSRFQTEIEFVSSFCKSLNEALPTSENEEKYLLYGYDKTKTLLKNLIDVDDVKFSLTRFEEKLLGKALIYASSDKSSSYPKDENMISDSESNTKQGRNGICSYCKGTCSNILLAYEEEINSMEN